MCYTKHEVAAARKLAKTYGVIDLLTLPDANAKLAKAIDVHNVGLSLAQAKTSGVIDLCRHKTMGCVRHCVAKSGRARVWRSIPLGRKRKTKFYAKDREAFLIVLYAELLREYGKAYDLGQPMYCRLNVFSDVDWENVAPWLFSAFGDVTFYDYTKDPIRYANFAMQRNSPDANFFPRNYHLTRSYVEGMDRATIDRILQFGGNVAVAFRHGSKPAMPTTWQGFEVINGDKNDLRPDDKPGTIVGLKAKGSAKHDTTGFVVDLGVAI